MIQKLFPAVKAPTDILTYGFDFSAWLTKSGEEFPALAGDTIASASFACNTVGGTTLSVSSPTVDDSGTLATTLVSGGMNGADYALSCTITTQAGQVATAQQVIQCRTDAR